MLRRWIRRGLIFVSIIIILLIGVVLFLHTDAGRSIVQKQLRNFLRDKWNTEVVIGNVDYRLPYWIALEKVAVLDRKSDTVLNAGRMYVGINLLKLLSNKVEVTSVILEDINIYCEREQSERSFNFQFIIDAFAPSSRKAPSPPERSQMYFSVNDLRLNKVRLSYRDERDKFYFNAFIDELTVLPAALSPENNEFNFDDFILQNTEVAIVDSSALVSIDKADAANRDPAPFLAALRRLELRNVVFSYKRPRFNTEYSLRVDNLRLRQLLFNVAQREINADNLALSGSSVYLRDRMLSQKQVTNPHEGSPGSSDNNTWKFAVQAISLSDNSFVYQDEVSPKQSGLDLKHVNLQNIHLYTTNNTFDSSGVGLDIHSVSLLYNNQLNLKKLSGKARVSDSLLKLQDLTIAFNQSNLNIDGDLSWPLSPDKSFANASSFRIDDLSVEYRDLLFFKPELNNLLPVSLLPSDKIKLTGHFSGTSSGVKAERLTLSTPGGQLHFTGDTELKINNGAAAIDAHFHQLRVRKHLLTKSLLQSLHDKNIQLPEELLISGTAKLASQQIIADLKLNSEYGQLQVNGVVTNIKDPQYLGYELDLYARDFETGKWIGLDSSIGKITGNVLVNGKGIEPKKMIATAQLQLASAVLNNYPFENINLWIGLDKALFTVRSDIDDPNLNTEIDLDGSIDPGYSVRGKIRVKNADLFSMGILADSFQYAGNIAVEASFDRPNEIKAYLGSDSNTVFIKGRQISTESFSLRGYADSDTMMVNVLAPFMEAELTGNYPLDSLSSQLLSVWSVLHPLNDTIAASEVSLNPAKYQTSLDVIIKPDTLLNTVLPWLTLSEPLSLNARYACGGDDSGLDIKLSAPAVSYANIDLRDWKINAKQEDSVLQFVLTGSQQVIGKGELTESAITGQIQKGLLTVKGQVTDSTGGKLYAADLKVQRQLNETVIQLQDDLTFNRNHWKVSPTNKIRLGKDGVIINDMELESRPQKIVINTKEQQFTSPIEIRVDSFELRDMMALLAPGETIGASGTINANFSIRQPIEKIPVITGDIKATNLALFDSPLGDFLFHSSTTGDSLFFNGRLSGANELDVNGGLHLKDDGIYLRSHLKKFNLEVVQGFTKDLFADLSGKIAADLQVSGSLTAPKYQGVIELDSTRFKLLALNTLYRIDEQKLLINDSGLQLQPFSITDSGGNKLNISGKVGLFAAGEKPVDLAIDAKNFMLLNAVQNPDVSLYGRGIIDANLSVKGAVDAPTIVGDAHLRHHSQIHLISGNNSKVRKTRTDGIRFVDIDTISSATTEMTALAVDSGNTKTKQRRGLDFDLDLKVDKDAQFNIVLDPSTDDELSVSGDARLQAGLLDNGKVGIEGLYNLQSGYYKINNLLLRGKFMLVKGSSISFSGDPSLADADITSEYIVEASPKGLLNDKDSDDPAYSQRVPFGVILSMKGPVSRPALLFDIQLRPGKGVLKSSVKSDVEHALDRLRTDAAEMNKQVFSLLLTKRFAVTSGYNALESSNLNASNALKEGVSSFLTEAMNQAADQMIKGVDVDVNMKTYKTDDDPISKTDLGVAVSKGLMEDRLIIRIEENFPVGNSSIPAKSGSQYIPDITSTYKLSKDGRFQLKGYQKNEYDAVVQGYFTEIGVNFTIEVSYEKFREIVKRRKNLTDEKR
ncbi:translocation/assembly module TamB domain-containing protein [Flavitalea antarctica]